MAQPATAEKPAVTMKVGEVVLSGITEESPALYQVSKASFNNVNLDVSGTGTTFNGFHSAGGCRGLVHPALGPPPRRRNISLHPRCSPSG